MKLPRKLKKKIKSAIVKDRFFNKGVGIRKTKTILITDKLRIYSFGGVTFNGKYYNFTTIT